MNYLDQPATYPAAKRSHASVVECHTERDILKCLQRLFAPDKLSAKLTITSLAESSCCLYDQCCLPSKNVGKDVLKELAQVIYHFHYQPQMDNYRNVLPHPTPQTPTSKFEKLLHWYTPQDYAAKNASSHRHNNSGRFDVSLYHDENARTVLQFCPLAFAQVFGMIVHSEEEEEGSSSYYYSDEYATIVLQALCQARRLQVFFDRVKQQHQGTEEGEEILASLPTTTRTTTTTHYLDPSRLYEQYQQECSSGEEKAVAVSRDAFLFYWEVQVVNRPIKTVVTEVIREASTELPSKVPKRRKLTKKRSSSNSLQKSTTIMVVEKKKKAVHGASSQVPTRRATTTRAQPNQPSEREYAPPPPPTDSGGPTEPPMIPDRSAPDSKRGKEDDVDVDDSGHNSDAMDHHHHHHPAGDGGSSPKPRACESRNKPSLSGAVVVGGSSRKRLTDHNPPPPPSLSELLVHPSQLDYGIPASSSGSVHGDDDDKYNTNNDYSRNVDVVEEQDGPNEKAGDMEVDSPKVFVHASQLDYILPESGEAVGVEDDGTVRVEDKEHLLLSSELPSWQRPGCLYFPKNIPTTGLTETLAVLNAWAEEQHKQEEAALLRSPKKKQKKQALCSNNDRALATDTGVAVDNSDENENNLSLRVPAATEEDKGRRRKTRQSEPAPSYYKFNPDHFSGSGLTETNHRQLLPEAHRYDKYQSAQMDVIAKLPASYHTIAELGDGDRGMPWVKDKHNPKKYVHSYDHFPILEPARNIFLRAVMSNYVLCGYALKVGPNRLAKQRKALETAVRQDPVPSILFRRRVGMDGNGDGDGPLAHVLDEYLAATVFHRQREPQNKIISIYLPHIDTIASSVAFVTLQGYSYNFVAVPSMGYDDQPAFDEDCEGWKDYREWKEGLSDHNDDRKRVEKAQDAFLAFCASDKRSRKLRSFRILTFRLGVGQALLFAAGLYPHFTIIPAQEKVRVLGVMHQLVGKH